MSAYVLQHDSEDSQTGESVAPPDISSGNSIQNRGIWKKSGRAIKPPRDDAVFYPNDDYSMFAQVHVSVYRYLQDHFLLFSVLLRNSGTHGV